MNFFKKVRRRPQRKGQNCQKQPRQVGRQIAQAEQPGADAPEVERPAQHAEDRPVQADPALPGVLGPQEEGQGGQQPEQQVQGRTQERQLDAAAQDAEQVVDHPQGAAQQKGLAQGGGLLVYIDGHPPNRRLNRPPRSRPPPAS